MDSAIEEVYGNSVRVRVCGLCWKDDRLLMVNHRGLTPDDFWAPPGGGVEFGDAAEERLRQEFLEETGLRISVSRFLFACEFVEHPLHSIELFFDVAVEGGELTLGSDPELDIIQDVTFMTAEELAKISDSRKHGIFRLIPSAVDLRTLTGFFRV